MDHSARNKGSSNPVVKTAVRIAVEEFQTWMSKQREQLEQIAPPMDVEGVVCDFDNPYINRTGVPLAIDWIKPADEGEKDLPVVVIIHGGMLIMGDRSTARRLGVNIAKRGYLVAIPDYRLIPATDIRGQFDDICAGLDYVGKNLIKYDVDFDLVSGRYVIDAKSIMGIFSLDLSKPIELKIHSEDVDGILAAIKPYTVE